MTSSSAQAEAISATAKLGIVFSVMKTRTCNFSSRESISLTRCRCWSILTKGRRLRCLLGREREVQVRCPTSRPWRWRGPAPLWSCKTKNSNQHVLIPFCFLDHQTYGGCQQISMIFLSSLTLFKRKWFDKDSSQTIGIFNLFCYGDRKIGDLLGDTTSGFPVFFVHIRVVTLWLLYFHVLALGFPN